MSAVDVLMPPRVAALPRDHTGRPVPWFVAWLEGPQGLYPEFRVIGPGKIGKALVDHLCWVCGTRITLPVATFVIGPMCAVNRVTAEPPCHRLCAVYAAQACPFLANPRMRRRENNLPAGTKDPAGVMIRGNPGVTLLWTTERFDVWFPEPGGSPLISLGDPLQTEWFCEGRAATRAEVTGSIGSGLPALREAAAQDGPKAVAQLDFQLIRAMRLMPPKETS